jgi:hypothetical protein
MVQLTSLLNLNTGWKEKVIKRNLIEKSRTYEITMV